MSLSLEMPTGSLSIPIQNKETKALKPQKTWDPDSESQKKENKVANNLLSSDDEFANEKIIQKKKNTCIYKKESNNKGSLVSKLLYILPHIILGIVVICLFKWLQAQLSELETRLSMMNTLYINNLSQKNSSNTLNEETSSINYSHELEELRKLNEELKKQLNILQKNYETNAILLSDIQKTSGLHTNEISQIKQNNEILSQVKISSDQQNDQISNIKNKYDSQTQQISQLTQSIENLGLSSTNNNFALPIGTILASAGSHNNDTKWIPCDGRVLPRSEYPDLFNMIGTTYGEGDGIYTFNIPDLRGRTIIGSGKGNALSERIAGNMGGVEFVILNVLQIPKHSHVQSGYAEEGFNYGGGDCERIAKYRNSDSIHVCIKYNTSPVGESQPHENMQPFLVTYFLIKVK